MFPLYTGRQLISNVVLIPAVRQSGSIICVYGFWLFPTVGYYKILDMFPLCCFPSNSDGKIVCFQCWRPGFNPWVRKIPWRRKRQPTPVLLPGKFHGWKNLIGYSPWGCKESDMTKRLCLHFSLCFHQTLNIFSLCYTVNPCCLVCI